MSSNQRYDSERRPAFRDRAEDVAINGSTYVDLIEINLFGQCMAMRVSITPDTADMQGFRMYFGDQDGTYQASPIAYGATDFDPDGTTGKLENGYVFSCSAAGPHEVTDGSTADFHLINLLGIDRIKFTGLGSGTGTATIITRGS